MMDGFRSNLLEDPDFISIMNQDLLDGQPGNIEGKFYFTTSYLHIPEEFEAEIMSVGFESIRIFAIESFSEMIPNLHEKMMDLEFRQLLLSRIRMGEQDKEIIGMSSHILVIGKKI